MKIPERLAGFLILLLGGALGALIGAIANLAHYLNSHRP